MACKTFPPEPVWPDPTRGAGTELPRRTLSPGFPETRLVARGPQPGSQKRHQLSAPVVRAKDRPGGYALHGSRQLGGAVVHPAVEGIMEARRAPQRAPTAVSQATAGVVKQEARCVAADSKGAPSGVMRRSEGSSTPGPSQSAGVANGAGNFRAASARATMLTSPAGKSASIWQTAMPSSHVLTAGSGRRSSRLWSVCSGGGGPS